MQGINTRGLKRNCAVDALRYGGIRPGQSGAGDSGQRRCGTTLGLVLPIAGSVETRK